MQVDIIYDTVCPWCYIGKRRFERARALRPNVEVTPRWRPFLLNPDMPADGIDRTAYLVRKFGSEARVRRIFGAISEAGQSVEIGFAFDRIGRTPNSVNSHRFVRFADARDRAEAAVETLFHAFFIGGGDIGDTGVLLDLGRRIGLDADALGPYLDGEDGVAEVYEDNSRAHRLGINGVPSFVFNGRMVISGAQEPPVIARILDAARESETAA